MPWSMWGMAMLRFDVSKEEHRLCFLIGRRAREEGLTDDQLRTEMDVVVTHANGCPLYLEKLLTSSEGDFSHDILGIDTFLDRKTGTLLQLFSPRCSA